MLGSQKYNAISLDDARRWREVALSFNGYFLTKGMHCVVDDGPCDPISNVLEMQRILICYPGCGQIRQSLAIGM